jgi:hypothetical protein
MESPPEVPPMHVLVNRSLADLIRDRSVEVDQAVGAVPELLAAWDEGTNGAASRAGQILETALGLPTIARGVYHEAWDAIRSTRVPDIHETGEAIFALWDKCIHALEYLRDAAVVLERYGRPVAARDRLDSAISAARTDRDRAHRGWPWMSAEDDAAVRAEIEHGGGTPVEEILRELQADRQ